jgi:iron complex outermembrane receptor protein
MAGLKASLDANYWGEYYLDYTNRLTYPAKTTVDASVAYSWDRYKIWIIGKNILDEKVERPINTTGRLTEAGGDPRTPYYVQDRIYLEAGLTVNF